MSELESQLKRIKSSTCTVVDVDIMNEDMLRSSIDHVTDVEYGHLLGLKGSQIGYITTPPSAPYFAIDAGGKFIKFERNLNCIYSRCMFSNLTHFKTHYCDNYRAFYLNNDELVRVMKRYFDGGCIEFPIIINSDGKEINYKSQTRRAMEIYLSKNCDNDARHYVLIQSYYDKSIQLSKIDNKNLMLDSCLEHGMSYQLYELLLIRYLVPFSDSNNANNTVVIPPRRGGNTIGKVLAIDFSLVDDYSKALLSRENRGFYERNDLLDTFRRDVERCYALVAFLWLRLYRVLRLLNTTYPPVFYNFACATELCSKFSSTFDLFREGLCTLISKGIAYSSI